MAAVEAVLTVLEEAGGGVLMLLLAIVPAGLAVFAATDVDVAAAESALKPGDSAPSLPVVCCDVAELIKLPLVLLLLLLVLLAPPFAFVGEEIS